ncbi:DMT family transporter [Pseudooceanicola sp. CBS1P-1]|uniref:EamA family transporter n=1 Tax=Pseudooceanicola albus TaxID=2692189 RepID=A0A6L7GC14_9RHOB|nr:MULTISPECIES: DMT family transporter [Pseudooceanicola]MBT9382801.1 DMT family transporter [Pseudooceanicola endophyticus]MXN21088.1 EamA family transporter [Pseudooceanicola albus]
MTDNLRAAGMMTVALLLLTISDAIIKLISVSLPLSQIIVLRNGLIVLALLAVLARRRAAWQMSRRDWSLVLLRAVGEIGAAWFYLYALVRMPFANVVAVLQSTPLVVTLGAALFLGEAVGWRRLLAILAGFLGVLMIVRPGTDAFDVSAIYVLISVLFVALRDLCTRRLSAGVSSLTVTTISAAAVMAVFAVTSGADPWQPASPGLLTLVALTAGLVLLSYLAIIEAMRRGEISFVSPFRYTSLIWALIAGLMLFGEWPRLMTLAGAAVIVASGLFTLYREARAGRRRPVAAAVGPEMRP